MKTLIPILLLSISLHAQDEIIIDFREEVIVWQQRETKRGKKIMVELYSGYVSDIGPFIAQVNEPSTLVISSIEQDFEYYIHIPDGLNRGIPLYLKWERKDITIHDTETGAVVTMKENTAVFK